MTRPVSLVLCAIASAILLGGCRVKSIESYESATTANPPATGKTVDPYTFGGSASASGGKNAQTSYATSTPGSGVTTPAVTPAKK